MNKKFKRLIPIAYRDVLNQKLLFGFSTKKTKKLLKLNGFKFFEYLCDITSYSHPVYTGSKKFINLAGRIEKFNKKFKLL
ncbi:50S ribosomal protein L31 [Candidatus Pinguicoccus supinus]|uniref:50S ribosomal protein L31 n=1 Tax=Candidatus Pinguicoccus supinus TaxID=2529394 RepID=A0A7T0FYA3_9BACT|nr:50S ribosomal protein L31 [Candidatus Pinguicoccus supinus]